MPDIVVMFFLLGLLAGLLKSNLTLPKGAYETLSLLLMLTIGLKGGLALHGELSAFLLLELVAVAALGVLIALVVMPILKYLVRLDGENTASIAAHYGSVSAGTFAVVLAYAETNNLVLGGQATLYLVMLELPAIVTALAIYNRQKGNKQGNHAELWRETLTNRGVILLTGGVVIGLMYGPERGADVTSLLTGAFNLMLAIFLLEMGLTAADTLSPIPWKRWRALCFALVAPVCLSFVGLTAGLLLNLPVGSVLVLATLTASASYIAAPAAIRTAIPRADLGLAMLMSLGITFPFNVLVGIPLYHSIIERLV